MKVINEHNVTVYFKIKNEFLENILLAFDLSLPEKVIKLKLIRIIENHFENLSIEIQEDIEIKRLSRNHWELKAIELQKHYKFTRNKIKKTLKQLNHINDYKIPGETKEMEMWQEIYNTEEVLI